MNHFEFYGIPVSFYLDESDLRKRYLLKSRQHHPDFFTLEDAEAQAASLELSTQNNQAYAVLSDFDKRLAYILDLHGLLGDGKKNEVPNDFLLDIMEINEALMELESDPDEQVVKTIHTTLKNLENDLLEAIQPALKNYDGSSTANEGLEKVKDFFLKKRYLDRIYEKLHKFASA